MESDEPVTWGGRVERIPMEKDYDGIMALELVLGLWHS